MIKDLCTVKTCFNFGRYARPCGHLSGSVKAQKPIEKESKERAKVNRQEYSPKAARFVKDNPTCQVKSPVCTGKSQCVHHKIKKDSKELLLNDKFWMASCFRCNTWIEDNDAVARQQGLKLSKFAKHEE